MPYLKFLNSESIYNVKIIPENNIITIMFYDNGKIISTEGFDLFNDENCTVNIGGDFYHSFNTIYRNDEITEKYNGYQLSNDGSVYIKPKIDEPTIEDIKRDKINEISSACQNTIFSGIDVQLSSGQIKHYSLKTEDQINLIGKQVQLASDTQQFEYHADGQPCEWYSREDIQNIINQAFEFISYNTTYCNSLFSYINSLNDEEKIKSIFYGEDVPAEYQSPVLKEYINQRIK